MKDKLALSILSVVVCLNFAICCTSTGDAGSNEYSNRKLGISFTVPTGIELYTAENPGPLASQISPSDPFILVNPNFTEENINAKISEPISEADLNGFKKMLDENPRMSLPQYKRVSVNFIKIGKEKNKNAVEHVFFMKGNILGKLRQITFVHKGRGFTFTCATAVDRFDKADLQFFQKIFDSMAFK
jgi:hypothetical protein